MVDRCTTAYKIAGRVPVPAGRVHVNVKCNQVVRRLVPTGTGEDQATPSYQSNFISVTDHTWKSILPWKVNQVVISRFRSEPGRYLGSKISTPYCSAPSRVPVLASEPFLNRTEICRTLQYEPNRRWSISGQKKKNLSHTFLFPYKCMGKIFFLLGWNWHVRTPYHIW